MSTNEETLQGRVMWTPPEGKTRMDTFRDRVNKKHGLHISNYAELHQWSVTNLAAFWQAVWDEIGIRSSTPASEVLPENPTMFPPVEWFFGAHLNFAENIHVDS